jgi:hypothetical protein
MEQKKKVEAQRKDVKEKLYPFLVKNSENIEDAKVFMSAIGVAIKQAFLNGMRTMPVKDLKMVDMLDAKGTTYGKYKEMFELINDYTITDAINMIEGMPNEIDASIREEMQTRKLDSLNIKLL